MVTKATCILVFATRLLIALNSVSRLNPEPYRIQLKNSRARFSFESLRRNLSHRNFAERKKEKLEITLIESIEIRIQANEFSLYINLGIDLNDSRILKINEGKRGFITIFCRLTRLVSFFFSRFLLEILSNISRDKFDAKRNIKISRDLTYIWRDVAKDTSRERGREGGSSVFKLFYSRVFYRKFILSSLSLSVCLFLLALSSVARFLFIMLIEREISLQNCRIIRESFVATVYPPFSLKLSQELLFFFFFLEIENSFRFWDEIFSNS